MSLLNLGVGPFLLGLAALAGLLFLLQRLRVRFSETEVVTTLFWKQAVEETRARILMRRFRHPLAYLLALAIAGLVWLAFAEPGWRRDAEVETIFLLDGSAGMGWGDRFEKAQALLQKEADRVPAERRRIYFCGAEARLVLDRGEETCLLKPRLAALAPEACPSSIERELFALAADETMATGLKLLVVGDGAVSEAMAARLPDYATVERLRSEESPRLASNSGIAAIGVAAAASGAFDRVDVIIEVVGDSDARIAITLGGQALDQAPTKEEGTYYLRDLPARGDVLEIALVEEDVLAVDNRARITLPARQLVAVEVDENLDERFHGLVEADPALMPAAADTPGAGPAQVVVGGLADGSLPAIELVTGNGIAVIYEDGLSPVDLERLQARFSGTGLDRVGRKLGSDPENIDGFQLSPRYVPGVKRKVQIGVELIGDDYDFLQSSAFPLFVSTAIRWLAGVEAVEPFAIAGERSAHAGHFILAGGDYAPPRAGRYLNRDGRELEVALAAVRSPHSDALKQVTRSTAAGRGPSLVTWCILIALVLVGGEWWLFQKGRIP